MSLQVPFLNNWIIAAPAHQHKLGQVHRGEKVGTCASPRGLEGRFSGTVCREAARKSHREVAVPAALKQSLTCMHVHICKSGREVRNKQAGKWYQERS